MQCSIDIHAKGTNSLRDTSFGAIDTGLRSYGDRCPHSFEMECTPLVEKLDLPDHDDRLGPAAAIHESLLKLLPANPKDFMHAW